MDGKGLSSPPSGRRVSSTEFRWSHFTGDAHPDPERIARQISERDIFDIDCLERPALGARHDRAFSGLRFGRRNCFFAA